MAEVSVRHRVQWGETDTAAIVFYPNYFRWFDEGTHALFRAIGFPIVAMLDRGYSVPLIESAGRFRSALNYDDEVDITSRFAEVRSRSFRIDHTVLRGDHVVVEGHEVRVWVRVDEHGRIAEPECIPDDLRRSMEAAGVR